MLTVDQIERERLVLERLCAQHPVEMVYVDQICRQAQAAVALLGACRHADHHLFSALGGDDDKENKARADRIVAPIREAIAAAGPE